MLYQDTFLTVYILVIAGVLGAVFGSFLNCMNVIFFETTYQATTTAGLEEATNENTTSGSTAQ